MTSKSGNGLKLLIWKNFKIKFRHKKEMIIEIIVPLLFCGIFFLLRNASRQNFYKDPTIFAPLDIKELDSVSYPGYDYSKFAYAPSNKVTDQIANDAVNQLNIEMVGLKDNNEMESYMMANHLFYGVHFTSINEKQITRNLDFTLRVPPNFPNTTMIYGWDTSQIIVPKLSSGPIDKFSDQGDVFGYISQGVAKFQLAISNAVIRTIGKEQGKADITLPDIFMQRFPYPPYMADPILELLDILVVIIFVISFAYPISQIVKHVTIEKDKQLTETMKIMGLKTFHHWTSWFLTSYLFIIIAVAIIVLLLKIPVVNNTAIFPFSSPIILLLFLFCYGAAIVTFGFFVSTLFERPVIAGSLASILFFLTYLPYQLVNANLFTPSKVVGTVLCLFLNTGMGFGFKSILQWEARTEGAQFSNLFSSAPGSPVSVGLASVMLIVDAILYMVLALYIEKVWPGKYGVKHKWNFFLVKPKEFSNTVKHHAKEGEKYDPDRYEEDPANANKNVGVRIENLRKVFGDKVAVDGLSLDMYENEITVLLGHNGAGKTTTISMITGFLMPSSGKIAVNGIDTAVDMDEIRKSMGICPQFNILFDDLTVQEHIIFYSRLKGFDPAQIEDEITKYLRILQLEDKRYALTKTLSGGMKRKLSLGVALCGGSKVVLCDEPSSGMDPEARRALWNLLEKEKNGRTILLTTHFMDEADVLGDRIAIMSGGKLTCSGTPFFLKKKFGTGYQLICNKAEQCNPDKVTALIRKHVPNLTVKSNVGTELSYSLPDNYVPQFENLLSDLESGQESLGLTGYGISMTTLEDVFMQTGSELHKQEYKDMENDTTPPVSLDIRGSEMLMNRQRYRYQWEAMFYKKILCIKRSWLITLIQILLPLIFLCFIMQNISFGGVSNLPALKMGLDNYGSTNTLLSSNVTHTLDINSNVKDAYQNIFDAIKNKHKLTSINTGMISAIVALDTKATTFDSDGDYVVAASISDDKLIAWFNHEIMHTVPTSLSLMQNAVVKALLGKEYNLHVTIHPLPYSAEFQTSKAENPATAAYQIAINLAFSMPLISAMFALFVVKERVSRAKLLQFAGGVPPFTFWVSHLLVDLLVYLLIGIGVVLLCIIFQVEQYKSAEALGALIVIFILYGLSSLPFTYLLSLAFDVPSTALSRIFIVNLISGMGFLIAIFVMRLLVENKNHVDLARGFFLLFPSYGLSEAIYNEGTYYMLQKACSEFNKQFGSSAAVVLLLAKAPDCSLKSVFAWEYPGIGATLLALAVTGVVFFIVLLLLDLYKRRVQNINNICRPPRPIMDQNIDDDVQAEKDRVENMTMEHLQQRTLVMRRLTKYYKKFPAVKNLSVAVEHGECFGLLGVNGAGKTSAFKMLTGDENISYGDVSIEGYNAQTDMARIYEMIGYCPQFDALLLEMTGYELLKMYCLIHGIPKYSIHHLIERLAVDLAFEEYLYRRVEGYSGGNRRKLNTAISLLGDPHIVYLDEPTSGIDPASRRKLWDMICLLRNSGKGIILTSHSMEECEALCTRIAIMVNGEFKCLGSTQHLKNKFSRTISLTVKMKKIESLDNEQKTSSNGDELQEMKEREDRVVEFIRTSFPGAELKECRLRLLTFEIPLNVMPYSRIFGLMEANRAPLMIEDYSLTQATLEQIFLQFARLQRINVEKKKKKKLICC